MTNHLPEHLKATLFGFRQNRDTGSLGADVSRACERKLRTILAAALAESQRPLMTEIGEEELSFCCGQEAGVECWEICTRRQLKEALADD